MTETNGEMHLASNNRYASFLLRLQWTQNDSRPTWLVSMQSTKTGELHWFPNLDGLIEFLRDEFDNCKQEPNSKTAALPKKDDHTSGNR
jgi:hypothetical protein